MAVLKSAPASWAHILRMIDVSVALPNAEECLEAFGLEDGDCLTAVVLQPKVSATGRSFALWCRGGYRIVTWGKPNSGDDSRSVQDQLRSVQQIQATERAFAAILEDGSVVTWGDPGRGGDSSAVEDQLKGVQQIQATASAFAAILEDGSAIAWGDLNRGGNSSPVQEQLSGVKQIQATSSAFAAILEDGSVVAWGDGSRGGSCEEVQDQLRSVQQIQATGSAFAAIFGRWISCHLGRSIQRRWQLTSPISAEECPANSGDTSGIRCDLSR